MPTNQSIHNNFNEFIVHFDFDTVAAGAVSTAAGGVRADGCTVTKTGVGTYTVTVNRVAFYEVLHRQCQLSQSPATAFWASITGVALSADSQSTVISITTWDDNATPAAANLGANGNISGQVVLRRHKIVVP